MARGVINHTVGAADAIAARYRSVMHSGAPGGRGRTARRDYEDETIAQLGPPGAARTVNEVSAPGGYGRGGGHAVAQRGDAAHRAGRRPMVHCASLRAASRARRSECAREWRGPNRGEERCARSSPPFIAARGRTKPRDRGARFGGGGADRSTGPNQGGTTPSRHSGQNYRHRNVTREKKKKHQQRADDTCREMSAKTAQ